MKRSLHVVVVASVTGRIDDIFASELNRCTASSLPKLRLERSVSFPVVCYESDDDEDTDMGSSSLASSDDTVLDARLEALQVQVSILGKDHTDVLFLSRRVQRLRSQSELLHLSLERIPPSSSRAHYFPRSAHMIVPADYPVQ
jgi:hypothetical protein